MSDDDESHGPIVRAEPPAVGVDLVT
jgi:hypothetical protein